MHGSQSVKRTRSADKTKHMVMSRDQDERRSHSIRADNSSFERVEEFEHLVTNISQVKKRLRAGNVCCH
jgi:hypothetical protein